MDLDEMDMKKLHILGRVEWTIPVPVHHNERLIQS